MLLFDLDGTLVDSSAGITRCAAHAFERLGEPVPDRATLLGWIGPPLRTSFATRLDDAARVEQALLHYRERYGAQGWAEYEVFPGMLEAIAELQAAGHRLAVVTAKVESYARRIVDSLSFGAAFEDVTGATEDGRLSHKPELIAEALARLGVAAGDCRMIGDRRMDMEGAVHHRMPGIGVLWGFGSADELQRAGATRLVDEPAALPPLFA